MSFYARSWNLSNECYVGLLLELCWNFRENQIDFREWTFWNMSQRSHAKHWKLALLKESCTRSHKHAQRFNVIVQRGRTSWFSCTMCFFLRACVVAPATPGSFVTQAMFIHTAHTGDRGIIFTTLCFQDGGLDLLLKRPGTRAYLSRGTFHTMWIKQRCVPKTKDTLLNFLVWKGLYRPVWHSLALVNCNTGISTKLPLAIFFW